MHSRTRTLADLAPGDGESALLPDESGLPAWQQNLAPKFHSERADLLDHVLRGPLTPDAIGFAWGAGDPRLIPLPEFRRALVDVLDHDSAAALGPEGGAGYLPLRYWLAGYLRQHGLEVTSDDVLVTGGTQQTISLIAETLLQPGDAVVTEAPTWPGALEVFEAIGARVIGVPIDRAGMQTDGLAAVLEREQPRLIYTVPTFQNPTGAVMSARRRRALCELAARHEIPVLEDDHVREVRFGQPIPPPLAAFDRRGNVIHAGGFTKSLIPTLRLGYVVARGPLREALAARKRTADLFAGLGTFALSMRGKVYAAEASRDAVLGLKRAAPNVAVEHRDLYRRPLDGKELNAFQAVVLDPPRAGAEEQVKALASSDVARIAYVSCNPATFARDAKLLAGGGYKLEWVKPVGQFRWSTHVELAAAFSR